MKTHFLECGYLPKSANCQVETGAEVVVKLCEEHELQWQTLHNDAMATHQQQDDAAN